MPVIRVTTEIRAPQERVFDLARSIDMHRASLAASGEEAVAGKITGLIGPGEFVTWRARHFFVTQELTSAITQFDRPKSFRDSMQKGAFKRFDHDHLFDARGELTVMTDVFDFTSPLGPLGWIADVLFLTRYMRRLLIERNAVVKEVAESEKWKEYLPCP